MTDAHRRAERSRALVVTTIARTVEQFLTPHIELLLDEGYEVEVCSAERPRNLDDRVGFAEIPFSRSPRRLGHHLRSYRRLRRRIRSLPAGSIIETHTPIASALVRLANRRRVPLTYFAHGLHVTPDGGRSWGWIERLLRPLTSRIVVINEQDHDTAVDRLGYPADRVAKLPGIGFERPTAPSSRRLPTDGSVIVVGHLDPGKRPIEALEAVQTLTDEVCVEFCGDGPLTDDLERRRSQATRPELVRLSGWVDDVDVRLERSRVLLFLSEREGLPVTVLQAMSIGMPIVAFPIRGVTDLLDGLDCWFRPASRSAADVADALSRALATDHRDEEAIARSRRYDVDASVSAHRSVLRRPRTDDATAAADQALLFVRTLRRGGAETIVRDLATDLSERGISCSVVHAGDAEDPAASIGPALAAHGIPTVPLGTGSMWRAWRLGRRARSATRRAIHCHSPSMLPAAIVAAAASRSRLVWTQHSDWRLLTRPARLAIGLAGAVRATGVAVSRESMQSAPRRVRPGTVIIHRPATRSDEAVQDMRRALRHRCGITDERPLVGSVLNMRPEKRPIAALQIALRVVEQHPTAEVVLAGDGPLFAEVAGELRGTAHADRVHLLGHVDGPTTVAGLDACFLCSETEGLPLTVLEAQAAGVPVVAPAIGGIPEVVPAEMLAPTFDDDAVVSRLLAVLDQRHEQRPHVETRSWSSDYQEIFGFAS